MKTFTPIAMKCTQEQFEVIKPKLKGCILDDISSFKEMPYLINNRHSEKNNITNYFPEEKALYNRTVHEEWNEEIFLKACGIETETLQEKAIRLENELKEVKQQIEDSKIKDGDWCTFWNHDKSKSIIANFQGSKFACMTSGDYFLIHEKITNPELIKLLEQEMN